MAVQLGYPREATARLRSVARACFYAENAGVFVLDDVEMAENTGVFALNKVLEKQKPSSDIKNAINKTFGIVDVLTRAA